MSLGRVVDARIAREVLGLEVRSTDDSFFEISVDGERPLRSYSQDMGAAQEVLEKMKMTVIPIEGGQWFVFVGPEDRTGWESPEAVLRFLGAGNFAGCGAASGSDLPALVCEAALKAVDKRVSEKMAEAEASIQPTSNNVRPLH